MVKPRENRVPIMLSEAELKVIDDWRFSNRVATRSDAIRRLCQMGLALDAQLTPLKEAFNHSSRTFANFAAKSAELVDPTAPNGEKAVKEMVTLQLQAATSIGRLKYTIRELTGKGHAFKQEMSIEESLEEVGEIDSLFKEVTEKMSRLQAKIEEKTERSSQKNTNTD